MKQFIKTPNGIIMIFMISVLILLIGHFYFGWFSKIMASGGRLGIGLPKPLCFSRSFVEPGHIAKACPHYYIDNKVQYVLSGKDDMTSSMCCYVKAPVPVTPVPIPVSCDDVKNRLSLYKQQLSDYEQKFSQKGCNILSSSRLNCKETKVIGGRTYTLANVISGNNGYQAVYISAQIPKVSAQYVNITKQQYDLYVSKCFPNPHPIVPIPVSGDTCVDIENIINSLKSKIASTEQQLLDLHCEGGHPQTGN